MSVLLEPGLRARLLVSSQEKKRHGPSSRCRLSILDGAKSVGAKILVSGGGRCKVTYDVVTPTDFFGNRHIIKNVLAAFPVQATIDWFTSLGVVIRPNHRMSIIERATDHDHEFVIHHSQGVIHGTWIKD